MWENAKKTAEISINLGVFKLSVKGEVDDQDKEIATRALDRIADHRAFQATADAEYAGLVVRSIKELRDWTQAQLEAAHSKASVRPALKIVIRGCRAFITEIEALNGRVSDAHRAALATKEAGGHLYDDQKALLDTINRVGNPQLLFAESLRLPELPTAAMTWQFLYALEKLRITAGFAVRVLEGISGRKAPRELRNLLPEAIEAD